MISVDYVRQMARYNRWQNGQVIAAAESLSDAARRADRGAHFGSIWATLNHLLWADRMWMSRLDGWRRPPGGIAESVTLEPAWHAWRADRERVDARIVEWSERLRPIHLRGDLTWLSGATGREMTAPAALCATHMFNHQTHHRGQIHAMLTAAGAAGPVSDLFLMPEHA